MVIRTLALCAGYGGLEIGLGAAFEFVGWEHRVAAYVEREAYAAALLASRMEAGALDEAPIWSDLTTFDARAWRGAVDCIAAGFPCQPHSHAGSRKGTDDERWIWPSIAGIIRDSGAWLVVLENVPGLLSSGGFDPVLTDLAEMGFDAEWGVLSAGSVGASHRRERVFIVAYRASGRLGELRESSERDGLADRSDAPVADPRRQHLDVQQRAQRIPEHPRGDSTMDYAPSARRDASRIGTEADSGSGQCVLSARHDAMADASGGAGVSVADPDSVTDRAQRFDDCEVGGLPQREGESEHGAVVSRRSGDALADTLRAGRQQIAGSAHGDESAHEGRRAEHDHEFASADADMANTSQPRREGREQHRTRNRDRGGAESTWIS